MSRYYGMGVEITKFDPEKADAIVDAANAEWGAFSDDWGDSDKYPGATTQRETERVLTAYGEENLCGMESPDEFCERLTKAIWKANGGFCRVEVRSTYLEDVPCEYHELSEDDFREFLVEETR